MSDEEFDEEAYREYEDELYHADSSGDDSDVDSEIADAIYGEVHYATALDIPETPPTGDTEGNKISGDKPQLIQSGDGSSGSDSAIDNTNSDNAGTEATKATFYVASNSESSDSYSEKDLQDDCFIVIEDIDGMSADDSHPGSETSTKLPMITVCSSSDSEVSDGEVHSTSPTSVESGEIVAAVTDPTEENWDLDEKDLTGNKRKTVKTVSRYYRPSSGNPHIRCYNCNERGHRANECPQPKKVDVCILCGITGHLKWRCPKELCFNCDEPGHQARACRKPRKRPYDSCRRCYVKGHMERECPDLWRQFHRTTRLGRVMEPSSSFKSSFPIYCYNCSKQGHYGHECVEDRMEKHISPAIPFVVNYGDCYASRKRPRHGETNEHDRFDRTHKRHSWPSHRDTRHMYEGDLGPVGDVRNVQVVSHGTKYRRQAGEEFGRGQNPGKMPRQDWRDEPNERDMGRGRDNRNLEYGYGGSGEDEGRTSKKKKKKKKKKKSSDLFPEEPINGETRSVEIVSGSADFCDDRRESFYEPKRKKKKKRQVDCWVDRGPVQEESYERSSKWRDDRRVSDSGDGRKNFREKRDFRGSPSWRPKGNPGFASDRGFRFGAGSKTNYQNNQKHRHKRFTH